MPQPPARAAPTRVHVLGHANPAAKDFDRLGVRSGRALLDLIRNALPPPYRLTGNAGILEAPEDQLRGGRRDDRARIRDIQQALDDPRTAAIIALNGGAYFSRIVPHLDFAPLAKRRAPLFASGFSEMTSLVNLVARYPSGRGLYWLCPNYLAWKVNEAERRLAYETFWRQLPRVFARYAGRGVVRVPEPAAIGMAPAGPIRARLVAGHLPPNPAPQRFSGGCLSVLAALVGGAVGRRLDPRGRWLVLEDVNEAPYRIDRCLAAFKLAGWFDHITGVLLGDFHAAGEPDQQPAVLELLRFQLPAVRRLPVLITSDVGHVWPMAPLLLNRPLQLVQRGRDVIVGPASPPERPQWPARPR